MSELEQRQRQLLEIRSWVAFDVDERGRSLVGTDELGSMQLVEVDADGVRRQLTRLPSRCSGRYIPGTRTVVVMHDNGGDERVQLSVLSAGSVRSCGVDRLARPRR